MSITLLMCVSILWSDGDSGRCRTADGVVHRIRLSGIDAGEVRPFTRCRQSPSVWACSPVARATADQAQVRARSLTAAGAQCSVVDRDRYRRAVVVCFANRRDVGRQLVREGLAISETNYGDPYRAEQMAAQSERLGIWQ